MLPGGTDERTNNEQGKIGLLSQWKLEAEFHNIYIYNYKVIEVKIHSLWWDIVEGNGIVAQSTKAIILQQILDFIVIL